MTIQLNLIQSKIYSYSFEWANIWHQLSGLLWEDHLAKTARQPGSSKNGLAEEDVYWPGEVKWRPWCFKLQHNAYDGEGEKEPQQAARKTVLCQAWWRSEHNAYNGEGEKELQQAYWEAALPSVMEIRANDLKLLPWDLFLLSWVYDCYSRELHGDNQCSLSGLLPPSSFGYASFLSKTFLPHYHIMAYTHFCCHWFKH